MSNCRGHRLYGLCRGFSLPPREDNPAVDWPLLSLLVGNWALCTVACFLVVQPLPPRALSGSTCLSSFAAASEKVPSFLPPLTTCHLLPLLGAILVLSPTMPRSGLHVLQSLLSLKPTAVSAQLKCLPELCTVVNSVDTKPSPGPCPPSALSSADQALLP